MANNNKKTAANDVVEEVTVETENLVKDNESIPASDQVLEACKGKFENVLVVGLDDQGRVKDFGSTISQYPFMHWTLNKALFELTLHEKNTNESK